MAALQKTEIVASAEFVAERVPHRPGIGIILGSGLGALADGVVQATAIPYREIPGFVPSTVEGHKGELVIGLLEGKAVAILRGRLHLYEGYSPQQVTFPVRVLRALGCHTLIVTNAAGGLNPTFQVGDLMLITDHINLPGMVGHNPLVGPNDPDLGPRFPDMGQAYDPGLRELARQVAANMGLPLKEGVYVMVGGPSYETPAEVRFLRLIGGDAVGMSTAAEVVVARHGGMKVLGISLISNIIPTAPMAHRPAPTTVAIAPAYNPLGHEEVLAAAAAATPKFLAFLKGIIKAL